jgi:ADP-ribose pyrophosphatase YjhB (NUDIX family)
LTVDIIILCQTGDEKEGIVLINRKKEPRLWALPGGFCEYGESLEEAAVREAEEETALKIELTEQFLTYSHPKRDPRHHAVTTVFLATAYGKPAAGDDAGAVRLCAEEEIPETLAFDHGKILNDYFNYVKTGLRPPPRIYADFSTIESHV